jgi:hypothetical protein
MAIADSGRNEDRIVLDDLPGETMKSAQRTKPILQLSRLFF